VSSQPTPEPDIHPVDHAARRWPHSAERTAARRTRINSDGPGDPGPPQYPISSVDNALRLILLFENRPGFKLADVARELNVVRSTAHRLLAMLEYWGFVTQDPHTEAYLPGDRLLSVGLAAVRQHPIREVARPILEDLVRELGETAHLAVLRGSRVLFLDGVESSRTLRAGSRVGDTLPAHVTASGKALLAELDDGEVTQLLPSRTLEGLTTRSIRDRDRLLADLKQVRRLGYAVNAGESEDDLLTVAAAVRDRWGTARASLVVAAPTSRVGHGWERTAGGTLRAAAERLGSLID
jgi:IclR family transcriptional regulator, acetate operon repressor